jgi:hypothetical protein
MLRIQIWSALAFSLLIMVGCKSMGSGTGASEMCTRNLPGSNRRPLPARLPR